MRHDCFLPLLTDQGKEFYNSVLHELCDLLRIKKLVTTGYRPQTNGLCERQNRVINQIVRALFCKSRTKTWHVLNTFPKESTGLSAFHLMYGREPRTPLEFFWSPPNPNGVPMGLKEYQRLRKCLNITRAHMRVIRDEVIAKMKIRHDSTHTARTLRPRMGSLPGQLVRW